MQQLEELNSREETIGPKTRGQVLRTEQCVLDMTLTPVRLPLSCETACDRHRALVHRFLYESTVRSPWCSDDACRTANPLLPSLACLSEATVYLMSMHRWSTRDTGAPAACAHISGIWKL